MKVAIIGLGYVGITSAACFAELGHAILGIEKNKSKINSLNNGHAGIIEPRIEELLSSSSNKIEVVDVIDGRINSADIIMIAVGTPTGETGTTDLTALNSVFRELSKYKPDSPILIRSTCPIGTTRRMSKVYGMENLIFHPEFLREGTAVSDFFSPPKVVFGATDVSHKESLLALYNGIEAETHFVDWETAESVKYADNIFHALKVTFTNEVSMSVSKKGANPNKVMEIFCSDRQLNLSPYYMKPGFAYGGSCLEKDLSSFRTQFSSLSLPLLDAITTSNLSQINNLYNKIRDKGNLFVFNGLTFKENIDDLRRSPFVYLCKLLLKDGKKVYAYDSNILNVFGESLEVKTSLVEFENFFLNQNEGIGICDVYVNCHKTNHLNSPVTFEEKIDLYPNPNIEELYL